MAVIDFLPDRLNNPPVVWKGFTSGEFLLAAIIFLIKTRRCVKTATSSGTACAWCMRSRAVATAAAASPFSIRTTG
nr:DUF3487 family protein [Kosakonia radicincitans]